MSVKEYAAVSRGGLHYPRPVLLSDFTGVRRETLRPKELQEPDFAARFDDDTLIYDAFWDADGRTIRMIGPPLLNLARELEGQRGVGLPGGAPITMLTKGLLRQTQWLVAPLAAAGRLALSCRLGDYEVDVGESHCDIFGSCRVLTTLSKNNRLTWIKDWIRFHRDLHGTDAVLIYDNGSTAYTPDELMAAVSSVGGLRAAVVVSWPFKYGPQGRADGSLWESYYLHRAMLEHARYRYLPQARSVIQGDIDELVVCDGSIHERAERSPFGIISYQGHWVVDGDTGGARVAGAGVEDPEPRHAMFNICSGRARRRRLIALRSDPALCPSKYTVVPKRCPAYAQWDSHRVRQWLPGRFLTTSVEFRHFQPINTSWKYDRTSQLFPPEERVVDDALVRSYARVRWNT